MRRGDDYRLIPEMMWKPDPNVEAARKLPKWNRFHRACGEQNLHFDHIERRDRRDTYKCTAFSIERRGGGPFGGHPHQVFVSEGRGDTVLEAIGDAFAKSGYDIPEAAELLAAGLQGEEEYRDEATDAADVREERSNEIYDTAAADDDDFDSLIGGDDLESLL